MDYSLNKNFNSNFDTEDDYLKINIFFDSINSYDLNTFTKCLHSSKSDIFRYTNAKNMNGKT